MIRARFFGISCVILAACSSGQKADTGDDAALRVSNATFFRGPMPAVVNGPDVESVVLQTADVRPGQIEKSCAGALAHDATGVALMLDGDVGYWILRADAPDISTPDLPSFRTSLSFSNGLTSGTHDLVARAVDAQNRFGAPMAELLVTQDVGVPAGHVVIALTWDTESDLDLHVVDPNETEIWRGRINSYQPPPPGTPIDPNAVKAGGILDFDSNASCVIDGRRREDVVWQTSAPSGHYIARVDTFSLCQATSANWKVEAFVDGQSIGAAQGESTPTATELPHDLGAGVTALEFDLP